MNREYVKRLLDRGWDVRIEAINTPHEIEKDQIEFFSSLGRGPNANWAIIDPVVEARNPAAMVPSPPDSVRVFAHLPITRVPRPARGQRVIFTMMESQKVNDNFINGRCNKFYEECWTPTEYNKKVFLEKGLKIPCKVTPIGIDPSFHPDNAIDLNLNFKSYGENAPEQPTGFTFLSVFRWSYRKGYDVLIRAFLEEFKKDDDVSLAIISRHAAMIHKQEFRDAVDFGIQTEYNKYAKRNSPNVYWCGDIIPMELMPSMYNIGDCFISCSRGEGFCIPVIEASKMGLPIIAPRHTGFTDYLDNDNSYLFDVDEWVVCNTIPEWKQWITAEFNGQLFPRFGQASVEQVRKQMRRVKENYEEAQRKNEDLKKVVDQKFSWDKCTDLVEENLLSMDLPPSQI